MKCALIAPPWPLFNRPSIQLGALSAYLKRHLKGVECKCFHPYLALYDKIGARNYGAISESSWASEAIGAIVFSPDHKEEKVSMALRALRARGWKWQEEDVQQVANALSAALEGLICSQDWVGYDIVGISVSLNQLTSGLYIAQRIKGISPSTKIVMGGASVSGTVGQSLLDEFEYIDAIVSGEGELPFSSLIKELRAGKAWRREVVEGPQLGDLDTLPIPDYDDFFAELANLSPRHRFHPILPVEFSRGCFWGRCAFCNLNIQWQGYRQKSYVKMKEEVLTLSNRYRCIDFAFMDNALPPGEASRFFSEIERLGLDLRFFGELRASISRDKAGTLGRAGLKRVQVGIEALSDALLCRMNKGRSVMENLAAMRHLLEAGISLDGNLILDFPATREAEVEETLENLEYAWFFRPLRPVSFWLGYGSPVFFRPQDYGIRRVYPHKNHTVLFPRCPRPSPMVYDYTGTKGLDRRMWRPVRRAIERWHVFWEKFSLSDPPLTYRDGGSVLIVRQALEDGTVYQHRLTGASRKIFLDILEPTGLDLIFTKYDNISKDRVVAFLKELMQKRIVYSDGVKALALPVRRR